MAEYIEKSVSLLSIEHEDPALKYAIERVPAADVVEVVHGEWVYCPETITLRSHFYCSACKVVRFEHYTKNNFKYCPNCGAKMDGKRKDCDWE